MGKESGQNETNDVCLDYRVLQSINFACAQNDVAIVERLAINNSTDDALTDVRIALRFSPPVIPERTWRVDRIAPKEKCEINELSTPPLDIERLAGLNEKENGELEFRVEAPGLQTITEKRRIRLLARDQWGGVGDVPHILAAFVSGSDSAVAGVLKDAARLLEDAGHDGSMDGYQSEDPRRPYLLASAIWHATAGLKLIRVQPPDSFEQNGQKVRRPDQIKKERLATCLDSSLFLAAAFEQAGLNSAVLFSENHAWVGVWICKSDFGRKIERDVVAVRKAVKAHKFVPVESTLLTDRSATDFKQAVDEAHRRLLLEDRDPEFVLAVDIARCRAAGIHPLNSGKEPPTDESEDSPDDGSEIPPLPPLPSWEWFPVSYRNDDVPATPMGRIERWQRKLLDLTLRNRLLNFRDTKQTLPLYCPGIIGKLEDELAAGEKFSGLSLEDEDPVGTKTVSPQEEQRIKESFARDAFEKRQVVVPLSELEMKKRFLTLFRRANSDIREGGTNTLFLAAGFLHWKKTESDELPYCAPLLLIPVKLKRPSVLSKFMIEGHEDGARINLTLLEYLKKDFDLRIPELEGDLPRDQSGVDVPRVFDIMSRKVSDVPGFEVVETSCALSTFSFAKHLMWKDLVDRTDKLRENRLVKRLIDGAEHESGSSGGPLVLPEEIDRRCSPGDLLLPLPADSSQLAAVVAASEGRDFILVGPPGTGKSQTIANMIAQCLGERKTVLFVAEKTAALNVVHRRLVESGLGDAVLDLHSNKSDWKSVVTQLDRSWDRASDSKKEQWINVTKRLKLKRDRLNAYAEALHAKGSHGFSVFDAIGRSASGKARFELSYPDKDAHDKESYEYLRDSAAELGLTYEKAGAGPPLSFIHSDEWSFKWQSAVLKAAGHLRMALDNLRRRDEPLLARELLGLRSDPQIEAKRRARLKALAPRVEQGALDLSSVPDMPPPRLLAAVEGFETNVKEFDAARSATAASYSLGAVRSMPLDQMDADWREAQTKIWPFSFFARRKVRKLLQTYADDGAAADPAGDLKALLKVRDRDAAMRESPIASAAWTHGQPDPDRARRAVCQAIEYRKAVADLRSEVEHPDRFEAATCRLACASGGDVVDALKSYLAAEEAVAEKASIFRHKGGEIPDESSVGDLLAGLATIEEEHARLPDWVEWVKKREAARANGLGPLVEALQTGQVQGKEEAEKAFERAYADWWVRLAIVESKELKDFLHWKHEEVIKTFRALDEKAAKLASPEVIRRVAHELPAKHAVPKNSGLGILLIQINKLGHHKRKKKMPIRELLASLDTTFGQLAPCVMMSPLSVAQYLPAGQAAFDIVIFDEASQITTWDAIGAIARAKQTIIVGDPKQLPPTDFFTRADDDDDEFPETEDDMPSILQEVSAAGVPEYRLRWHYRSRDEALIAFSNHFYYGNRLVTFPTPARDAKALNFHKVDGMYDRGKSRRNEAEARAIADMVKERLTAWLRDPEDQRHTLGVITFNAQQQSLILDLLDDMRRQDKRLEWFFEDDREAPVIVKNLENIQGDERDVMLLSVTFGPDRAGRLTMNFGPINNEGGERRLNVAVTRARRKFHVFSSIRSEQIDLARTNAVGVRHLKTFLDYADRGSTALRSYGGRSLGPPESPFEEAVAEALGNKGWEIHTQIGESGFRVDLAVVHPDHAGRYIAGIECDGASYHSSATARDRDKLRQAVLEGRGWTILRIWSTEWFKKPTAVTEQIHGELRNLLEKDREARQLDLPIDHG